MTIGEIQRSDRAAYAKHLNEREIYERTLAIPYPYTFTDADRFINWSERETRLKGRATQWVLREEAGMAIGGIGFVDWTPGVHRTEIGYWLAKPYWNRGLMTVAVGAIVELAFTDFALVRVSANVFSTSIARRRACSKRPALCSKRGWPSTIARTAGCSTAYCTRGQCEARVGLTSGRRALSRVGRTATRARTKGGFMKAVFIRRYGGPEVLEFGEVETPTPKAGEVRIAVAASSVNPIDWKIGRGDSRSIALKFPGVLGVDVAGTIESVGEGCSKFKVGDEVFAMMPRDVGGNAQFAVVAETLVAPKPKNLSFEQAASVPAVALTALQVLRDKGKVQAGQEVLVNGASGGVGIFAVQLAKVLGARVTAVCSAANADFVTGLGADCVIDYKATDFTKEDAKYHLVFDSVGNRTYGQCNRVMRAGGTYVFDQRAPDPFYARILELAVLFAQSQMDHRGIEWRRLGVRRQATGRRQDQNGRRSHVRFGQDPRRAPIQSNRSRARQDCPSRARCRRRENVSCGLRVSRGCR